MAKIKLVLINDDDVQQSLIEIPYPDNTLPDAGQITTTSPNDQYDLYRSITWTASDGRNYDAVIGRAKIAASGGPY